MTDRSDPATGYVAVTPSDTVKINLCRALYIGVSGDVAVQATDDSAAAVVFKGAPVGILPVQARRVMATGTTATDIVALY